MCDHIKNYLSYMNSRAFNYTKGEFTKIPSERLVGAEKKCLLGVDCSTAGTGFSLISMEKGIVEATSCIKQDKENESLIEYRLRLKESLRYILENNPGIFLVIYEPPIVGVNAHTTGVLFTLKGFAEEVVIEMARDNQETYRDLSYLDYINTKWKKHFFEPERCPSATKLAKEAIKNKMFNHFRLHGVQKGFEDITQDELDASAMALAYRKLILSFREDEAATRKKQRAFAYDYEILAVDDEQELFHKLGEQGFLKRLPKRLHGGEVLVKDWEKKNLLEKFLFQDMNGLDMAIAYKTKVENIGKLILERKLKGLATNPKQTVYVVCWRKNATASK